jgi:hypothetical protein
MTQKTLFCIFHGIKFGSFTASNASRFLFIFLWILTGLLRPTPAQAQAQAPGGVSLAVQPGFEGYCRDGTWTPIQITLVNDGAALQGVLQVLQVGAINSFSTGSGRVIYAQEISLPEKAQKTVTINVYLEDYVHTLRVQLQVGEQTVTSIEVPLSWLNAGRLYGIMAATSTPFNVLSNAGSSGAQAYVVQVSPASLPDRAIALEALDALIVSGIDTGSLSPAQQEALAGWVDAGGHLVVSGGPDWQRSAAGLSELLPVTLRGTASQVSLGSLNQLRLSPEALNGDALAANLTLKAGAQLLAGSPESPLIVTQVKGVGRITYLAFDPALKPFAGWAGQLEFYRYLLFMSARVPGWAPQGFRFWDAANDAAASLPGQNLPSATLVIGFMVVYVLAVGPVNYMVLRALKRREWAWLTIPGLVGLFCLIAYGVGGLIFGSQPALNRLTVVQSYPGVAQAQASGVVGIFSPFRTLYTFQTGPGLLAHPIFTTSNSGQTPEDWFFLQKPGGGVVDREVRVDVGGMRSVVVNGQVPAPDIHGDLTLELTGSAAVLTGEVVNASSLTLQRAVLLFPGGTQDLGTFTPGKQEQILASAQLGTQVKNYDRLATPDINRYYIPGSVSDPWLKALAGGSASFSNYNSYNSKIDDVRRYKLLSIIASQGNLANLAAPGKVYLAGWSDEPVLDAGLAGQRPQEFNTTLYLIQLESRVKLGSGDSRKIGPGLFTWRLLDATTNMFTVPYKAQLRQGSVSFSYMPMDGISYRSVRLLAVRLTSVSNRFPADMIVSLWDFTRQTWQPQQISSWGEHLFVDPEQYVSLSGEVRVRIDCGSSVNSSPPQLDQLDVSLEVQP